MAAKKGQPEVVIWSDHPCRCFEREFAEEAGEFVYARRYDGYIFPYDPNRSMSLRTRMEVYSVRHDLMHPDHGGEPYVWQECPWCQGELPKPPPRKRKGPSTQADGGGL